MNTKFEFWGTFFILIVISGSSSKIWDAFVGFSSAAKITVSSLNMG